jgi:hypothetical protein
MRLEEPIPEPREHTFGHIVGIQTYVIDGLKDAINGLREELVSIRDSLREELISVRDGLQEELISMHEEIRGLRERLDDC